MAVVLSILDQDSREMHFQFTKYLGSLKSYRNKKRVPEKSFYP